jgi:hypothetical protein
MHQPGERKDQEDCHAEEKMRPEYWVRRRDKVRDAWL